MPCEELDLVWNNIKAEARALADCEPMLASFYHATLLKHENLGSALKWGLAGALVLGPVGLIVGIWLGGKSEEITFIATLKDGRKLMAITDGKTYSRLAGTVRVFP